MAISTILQTWFSLFEEEIHSLKYSKNTIFEFCICTYTLFKRILLFTVYFDFKLDLTFNQVFHRTLFLLIPSAHGLCLTFYTCYLLFTWYKFPLSKDKSQLLSIF